MLGSRYVCTLDAQNCDTLAIPSRFLAIPSDSSRFRLIPSDSWGVLGDPPYTETRRMESDRIRVKHEEEED